MNEKQLHFQESVSTDSVLFDPGTQVRSARGARARCGARGEGGGPGRRRARGEGRRDREGHALRDLVRSELIDDTRARR